MFASDTRKDTKFRGDFESASAKKRTLPDINIEESHIADVHMNLLSMRKITSRLSRKARSTGSSRRSFLQNAIQLG